MYILKDESPPPEMRFGEGYVRPVDCTETDSDDDLVPYALDDDPDSTQPNPPRYLRTLMQGMYVYEGRGECTVEC